VSSDVAPEDRVPEDRLPDDRVPDDRVGVNDLNLTDDVRARLDYLTARRWFAGKGREIAGVTVDPLPWLSEPDADPAWRIELVRVDYADGGTHLYQMPLSYRRDEVWTMGNAFVGRLASEPGTEPRAAYDLPFDGDAASALLHWLGAGSSNAGFSAHVLDTLDEAARPLVLTGEQSNTNVVYGDTMMLKLFRRVQPGHNPDIEAHAALMRAEPSPDLRVTPKLLAWFEYESADGTELSFHGDLAMLTQFLPSATDGWAIATASVRDLLAEADLHADEVGGDFAAEAERLGVATAAMHTALSTSFQTLEWTGADLTALAGSLRSRLAAAAQRVPQLTPMVERIAARYDEIATVTGPVSAHRVHGDFHLGQTMRTIRGWKIIDFEGEPGAPYDIRVAPDSPLRDVAGMLRSIDYASEHLLADRRPENQSQFRAAEWRERNTGAFVRGYLHRRATISGGAPTGADASGENETELTWTAAERVLLRAYELDKAVYEVVYEADMRPDWIRIPLAALERLA
jgi:maltokinase